MYVFYLLIQTLGCFNPELVLSVGGIKHRRRFRDVTTRWARHRTPSRTLRNLFRSAGLCGARERRHRSGPGRQGRRWTGRDAEGRPGSARLPEGTGLGLAKRVNKTARSGWNTPTRAPTHILHSCQTSALQWVDSRNGGLAVQNYVRPQMCALKLRELEEFSRAGPPHSSVTSARKHVINDTIMWFHVVVRISPTIIKHMQKISRGFCRFLIYRCTANEATITWVSVRYWGWQTPPARDTAPLIWLNILMMSLTHWWSVYVDRTYFSSLQTCVPCDFIQNMKLAYNLPLSRKKGEEWFHIPLISIFPWLSSELVPHCYAHGERASRPNDSLISLPNDRDISCYRVNPSLGQATSIRRQKDGVSFVFFVCNVGDSVSVWACCP